MLHRLPVQHLHILPGLFEALCQLQLLAWIVSFISMALMLAHCQKFQSRSNISLLHFLLNHDDARALPPLAKRQ